MATFKSLNPGDIKTSRSFLNQLVDIIQEDISGSATRQKHLAFVTGGVGPGVTSSLFQTVYDQNFELQTANAMLDLTVGIFSGSGIILTSSTGEDSVGKLLFPSNSLMMREKIDVYRQFAQKLLGDARFQFSSPFSTAQPPARGQTPEHSDAIDNALFIGLKRLFSRDKIKKETFAMRFYQSSSHDPASGTLGHEPPNLNRTSVSGSAIFTDVGSSTARVTSLAGEVGNLVDASNTNRRVGLIFYDTGDIILDLDKVISGSEHASGTIDAMADFTTYADGSTVTKGTTIMGSDAGTTVGNPNAKFLPDFIVSASMDNIIDHIASCRVQSGSQSAMTFQNVTNINSTLVFCRVGTNDFNYSSNPTFVNPDSGRLRVVDPGSEAVDRTFTMLTTVGLYDANDNLLAVAKLSRPVEKDFEKELTIRVRLDF